MTSAMSWPQIAVEPIGHSPHHSHVGLLQIEKPPSVRRSRLLPMKSGVVFR